MSIEPHKPPIVSPSHGADTIWFKCEICQRRNPLVFFETPYAEQMDLHSSHVHHKTPRVTCSGCSLTFRGTQRYLDHLPFCGRRSIPLGDTGPRTLESRMLTGEANRSVVRRRERTVDGRWVCRKSLPATSEALQAGSRLDSQHRGRRRL